ncbi:MAG: hypothetical protein JWN46_1919, partial [Acidimicrobiales bacterium]|nr:hypothetical protein [Acidimicrobiales bacterium]
MGLLTVVLILGSVVRVGLLFLRPAAKERFHHPRRRLLATRIEQGGDILLLFTAACMVVFGYGRGSGGAAVPFWLVCLVGGLAMVAFAHDVARRHRPEVPPAPR